MKKVLYSVVGLLALAAIAQTIAPVLSGKLDLTQNVYAGDNESASQGDIKGECRGEPGI